MLSLLMHFVKHLSTSIMNLIIQFPGGGGGAAAPAPLLNETLILEAGIVNCSGALPDVSDAEFSLEICVYIYG